MDTNTSPAWPENIFGYKIAIEEMQLALKNNLESFDAVRNMARTLFGAASLIVGLLGTLQIISADVVPAYRGIYNFLITLTMIVYIGLIVCCLRVLSPNNIDLPIEVDWNVLWNHYISETDDQIYKTRLISYINAIQKNWPVITRLRNITRIATLLLPIIIVLILLISLLPRVP